MTPRKGYYSVIQYSPDPSRLESVNVGVLVFCPELRFVRARTRDSNDRVRRFFGTDSGLDISRINALKRNIQARVEVEAPHLRTVDDLAAFIGTLANDIRLTQPRPMTVTDPERHLSELLLELVGPPRSHAPGDREETRARRALEEAFRDEEVKQRVIPDVTVEVPVLRENLRVPYAYQNGRFSLVKPVGFARTNAIDKAFRYAFEGHSLFRHDHPQHGPLQLLVVAEFARDLGQQEAVVKDILTESSVHVFRAGALDDLVHDILTTSSVANP